LFTVAGGVVKNSEENDCNRRRICGISKGLLLLLLLLYVTGGGSGRSSSVCTAGGQSLSGSDSRTAACWRRVADYQRDGAQDDRTTQSTSSRPPVVEARCPVHQCHFSFTSISFSS